MSISGSSKILVVFICSYLLGDDPTRKARSISIKDVGWIFIKSGMFIAMGTLQDCRQTAMLQLHGRDDDVMPSAGRGGPDLTSRCRIGKSTSIPSIDGHHYSL